jgi:hypothetical protein
MTDSAEPVPAPEAPKDQHPKDAPKKVSGEPRPAIEAGKWVVVEKDRFEMMVSVLSSMPFAEVDRIFNLRMGGHIIPLRKIDAAGFIASISAAQAQWDREHPADAVATEPPDPAA